MGPRAPNAADASPAGAVGTLPFGSWEPNSRSFLELFPGHPEAAAPHHGAGAAGRPRSQPPKLALTFHAENVPPGISEFSTRAASQPAARGRAAAASSAPAPAAPLPQMLPTAGVVKPRAWRLRGQDGGSDGDLVGNELCSSSLAQPRCVGPPYASTHLGHPGAPPGPPAAHPCPSTGTGTPGKTHVLKHAHSSLFPTFPLVTSKHLMNSN